MYTTLNYQTLEVQPYANAEAVAEHLGISPNKLREDLRKSKIHAVRVGDILIEKKKIIQSKKVELLAKKHKDTYLCKTNQNKQ